MYRRIRHQPGFSLRRDTHCDISVQKINDAERRSVQCVKVYSILSVRFAFDDVFRMWFWTLVVRAGSSEISY